MQTALNCKTPRRSQEAMQIRIWIWIQAQTQSQVAVQFKSNANESFRFYWNQLKVQDTNKTGYSIHLYIFLILPDTNSVCGILLSYFLFFLNKIWHLLISEKCRIWLFFAINYQLTACWLAYYMGDGRWKPARFTSPDAKFQSWACVIHCRIFCN